MPAVLGTNVTTGACELRNGSLVGVSVDNSGVASAATATAGTNTTQLATTAFAKTVAESNAIGVGQTWQNVTASRVLSTTYTNSSGKPIMIAFKAAYNATSALTSLTIGSEVIESNYIGPTLNNGDTVYGIVPNNTTYSISSSKGIGKWMELR